MAEDIMSRVSVRWMRPKGAFSAAQDESPRQFLVVETTRSPHLHHFALLQRATRCAAPIEQKVEVAIQTKRSGAPRSFNEVGLPNVNTMWYVYILRSKVDQSCYTGCTSDLQKRIRDHHSRQTKTTASKAPYELLWFGAFRDKETGFEFERYLK